MSKHENEFERFAHAGHTVVLCYDPDALSPRDNDGNLSRIVHWHNRYVCGDERLNRGDFGSPEEIREKIEAGTGEILAILPVWLYDHSGTVLKASKASPFSDRWDSGQVGWAYVTRSAAEVAGCTPGKSYTYEDDKGSHTVTYDEAFFVEAIVDEVELFDRWSNGRFVGFIVEDKDGDEVESCWGFDDPDYARKEAKDAAEHAQKKDKEARRKFTKKAWKAAVAEGATEDGYEAWLKERRTQKGKAA